ncbi:MAG: superinfection immunity protein [Candidatus Yonathbacteria bacterium]|nr:superinfection immunity protein [Candidatus Yonathbacteria bacterium]
MFFWILLFFCSILFALVGYTSNPSGPNLQGAVGYAFLGFTIPFIYLIPSVVAYAQGKRNRDGVLMVNFFFGWTVLGWLAAFIWACVEETRERSDWRPGPAPALESKPVKKSKTALILNFILTGLLIACFIYPNWVLKSRHQAIKIFWAIYGTFQTNDKSAGVLEPKTTTVELQNYSDELLVFDIQKINPVEKRLYQEQIIKRHADWAIEIKNSVLNNVVSPGMTKEHVLASWGRPLYVKKKRQFFESLEQWWYSLTPAYVYFSNGKVSNLSDDESPEFKNVKKERWVYDIK